MKKSHRFRFAVVGAIVMAAATACKSSAAPDSTPAITSASTSPGINVSQLVKPIYQMDSNQYDKRGSLRETIWGPAACAPTSLTMVVNAYTGKSYKVVDILKVGIKVGLEDPATGHYGSVDDMKILDVASKFGLKAKLLDSEEEAFATANGGNPVMAGFAPQAGVWPSGHFVVLVSSANGEVTFANPWTGKMETESRATFDKWRNNGELFAFTAGSTS
ncbi:MAG TPA: C39 family peptidase, partial [Ktedonosporobacter sp.]|nr:C39 family peptidase [Ktedonosporobacter sp.]